MKSAMACFPRSFSPRGGGLPASSVGRQTEQQETFIIAERLDRAGRRNGEPHGEISENDARDVRAGLAQPTSGLPRRALRIASVVCAEARHHMVQVMEP